MIDHAIQQLGEPLGKGASAQVYSTFQLSSTLCNQPKPSSWFPEALNWTSGETVAIKQISISGIPTAELSDILVSTDLPPLPD